MSNPFDIGRTMLEAWEKNMGEFLEKLTRDEAFLKTMTQAVGSSLDVKKEMEGHVERYLKSVNMPTRTDLDRMFTYLHRIEGRLLDLEDRLDQMAPAAPPDPAAARPAGFQPHPKSPGSPKPGKPRKNRRPD